MSLPWA